MTRLVAEQRLVHRGHVAVSGLLYWGREEEWARRDILRRYAPGTRVFRHEGSLLVVFANTARIAVQQCPAVPLVLQAGLLTALPLKEPDERSFGLGLSLAQAGEIKLSDLNDSREEDPSTWLVLEDYGVQVGAPLRPPPPPPEMVVQEGTKDVREALDGAINDPHPKAKSTLQALNRAPNGRSLDRSANGLGRGLLRVGLELMAGVAGGLARALGAGASNHPRLPGGSTVLARSGPPLEPGLFRLFASRFKTMLWKSRLGSWLGREHAKYLGDLFDLLESGSYEEALRRAIPTGGTPGPFRSG